MANERVYQVARLTDKQIAKLYEEILSVFPDATVDYRMSSNVKLDHALYSEAGFPRTSYFLTNAHISIRSVSISIHFARGTSISVDRFTERTSSSVADEIKLAANSVQHQNTTVQNIIAVSKIIEKNTSFLDVMQEEPSLSSTAVLDAKLGSLSDLAADLIAGADEKRRELDSLKDSLEKEYEQKRIALDDAHAAELLEVVEGRKQLEALQKSLDDREHKHVRRELRETITTQIKDSLSDATGSKRSRNYAILVTSLSLLGAVIFAFLTAAAQLSISSMAEGFVQYAQYVKLFLSSAVTVGFVAYAISWMRRLAIEEATHHRNLEQYGFDMNRASWVIETILELTDAELEEVPSAWLESVCKNLFERQDQGQDETTSLHALAALLNVTTEAEIGPDGPTFKLNRRAAKKAAASGE
ncbi:hypothetical protein CLV80_102205 [Yoonia maritima]|uniref:Uncharacterized protein n=1 Tax=Yoonia maritima TaxID=1435347 RepID=A0A2T0W2Z9_9RHOB|nr:hypothetical protein [Yoonia maritima]PRY79560.1 hypothetical protein CLV80_102205 [Yoonia maritima]